MLKSVLKIHVADIEKIDLVSTKNYQKLNADTSILYWIDITESSSEEWNEELCKLGLNSTERFIIIMNVHFLRLKLLRMDYTVPSNNWANKLIILAYFF